MLRRRLIVIAGVVTILVGVKANADIPTQTPLAYAGVLQDGSGKPLTATQSIQLTVWDDATANVSANQKCTTPTQSVTPDNDGRFRIVLDQGCLDAVRANPNLWIQLQVGAMVLPRSKIQAVPFAVEAGRSSRVVLKANGVQTTAEGLFCNPSSTPLTGLWSASFDGGTIIGYRAGKRLCESACGSPTAHFCTAAEAVRSHVLGFTMPEGWVTQPMNALVTVPNPTIPSWLVTVATDCNGFTEQMGAAPLNLYGLAWIPTQNLIGQKACNQAAQILCCD